MTFININRLIVTNRKEKWSKGFKRTYLNGHATVFFLEGRSYKILYIEL
jgi:hypothetical protein